LKLAWRYGTPPRPHLQQRATLSLPGGDAGAHCGDTRCWSSPNERILFRLRRSYGKVISCDS
jgi:hypothetical protein